MFLRSQRQGKHLTSRIRLTVRYENRPVPPILPSSQIPIAADGIIRAHPRIHEKRLRLTLEASGAAAR